MDINCPHCGGVIGIVIEKQNKGEGQQKKVPTCVGCNKEIKSQKVIEYSQKNFGKILCMECQKNE